MNYLSLKMSRDFAVVATVHCYFQSRSHKKKITSFLPSGFLASSSTTNNNNNNNNNINFNNIFAISKQNLSQKSLRNGKSRQRKSSLAKNIKKPFWKKVLFGSKKLKSIILLNFITLIYASNIAVIKEVEAFTDPAYFSAVRFGISTIPFLPFIFRARNDTQARNSGLELGLWVSLGYLTEALGLVTSDAGRASFLSMFTVIVIPMLESMLGETIPARTWFGILMSVIGIFMLECSGSPPNIGDLFNFVSAIFFGIHTLRTEHISRTTKKEDFLALLGYEVSVVAILSTIWCLMGTNILHGILGNGEMSWTWALFWDWIFVFPWIPALYTGVFSTGLCLWGEIAAMRDVSATETAMIYGLEPLWGAGFAWFLLGERWGLAGWIGAALILGGSLTVQMFGASASKPGDEKKKVQKTLSGSPVMVKSFQGQDVLKK